MNEEINIEQQLRAELSRLKKAIDYIEQAEKTIQQFKQLNEQYKTQQNDLIESSKESSSSINKAINDLIYKLNFISDITNNNTDHISLQENVNTQFEDSIRNIKFEITNINYIINAFKEDLEQLKLMIARIEKIQLSVHRNNENSNEKIRNINSEILLLKNKVTQSEIEINNLKNKKWYEKLFRR